jgi:hypothetical protein
LNGRDLRGDLTGGMGGLVRQILDLVGDDADRRLFSYRRNRISPVPAV